MTTKSLQTEITSIDETIAQLYEQIAIAKEQKKQLVQQQKIANKVLSVIETAKEALSELTFGELANSIVEALGFKQNGRIELLPDREQSRPHGHIEEGRTSRLRSPQTACPHFISMVNHDINQYFNLGLFTASNRFTLHNFAS